MSSDQYTPSESEVQELIVGLLLDAGDYVRHGQPDTGETLTWDQRNVRAWCAARFLSELPARDARVRRDAAREFVDRTLLDWGIGEDENPNLNDATADDLRAAVGDTYPEETP